VKQNNQTPCLTTTKPNTATTIHSAPVNVEAIGNRTETSANRTNAGSRCQEKAWCSLKSLSCAARLRRSRQDPIRWSIRRASDGRSHSQIGLGKTLLSTARTSPLALHGMHASIGVCVLWMASGWCCAAVLALLGREWIPCANPVLAIERFRSPKYVPTGRHSGPRWQRSRDASTSVSFRRFAPGERWLASSWRLCQTSSIRPPWRARRNDPSLSGLTVALSQARRAADLSNNRHAKLVLARWSCAIFTLVRANGLHPAAPMTEDCLG
jgi:hypothetical protein